MHPISLSGKPIVLVVLIIFGGMLAAAPPTSQSENWQLVKKEGISGELLGISGMAWWKEGVSLVVVHDNKFPNQPRIGILTLNQKQSPAYIPMDWPAPLPVDLEAIDAIPGRENPKTFGAITSAGQIYVIEIIENQGQASPPTIRIIQKDALPDGLPQYIQREGFALQIVDESVIAVWADRGCRSPCNETDPPRAATLIWSRLDPADYKFLDRGPVKERSQSIIVGFPQKPCVRPVSDIKLDVKGTVFISSAKECENPDTKVAYQSVVYEIGTLRREKSGFVFQQHPQHKRVSQEIQERKIEALEFLPGAKDLFIFGTDDELRGGRIFVQRP